MQENVIGIGEIGVFNTPVIISCFGLGSCVGLFVKDRTTGISGGAHIFLPDDDTEDVVLSMFEEMINKGCDLKYLRAKVVGGGHINTLLPNTGYLIVQSVLRILVRHRVYIAAMDTGGIYGRTAKFNTSSEKLLVKVRELQLTKEL